MVTGPRDAKDWGKARLLGRVGSTLNTGTTATTSSVPLLPAIPDLCRSPFTTDKSSPFTDHPLESLLARDDLLVHGETMTRCDVDDIAVSFDIPVPYHLANQSLFSAKDEDSGSKRDLSQAARFSSALVRGREELRT